MGRYAGIFKTERDLIFEGKCGSIYYLWALQDLREGTNRLDEAIAEKQWSDYLYMNDGESFARIEVYDHKKDYIELRLTQPDPNVGKAKTYKIDRSYPYNGLYEALLIVHDLLGFYYEGYGETWLRTKIRGSLWNIRKIRKLTS